MRVMVTGVAGFLGSHVADALLARGDSVVGVDNMIGGYHDNIPKGVEFYQVDCNNLVAMKLLLRGVDLCYHFAATAHEGLSVFSPYENAIHGYAASASVFSACVATGVKRICFTSSMARFGTNEVPFTEKMEPRPQDPYGVGKVAAEKMLQLLGDVHGVEWVIAVPHSIIGPRQSYVDPYRNVVSIMINRMLQKKQPVIYGNGEQKRCFSFVSDVVDPLLRMGTDVACTREIINVGPDDHFITINQLAEKLAEIIGFELHPIYKEDRPQEVHLANCSADKARKLFGYAPKVKLEDGLRQMVDYIRERGPQPFRYDYQLEIVTDRTPTTWKDRLL